jgi:predicted CXXCH cytochrome family protein
MNRAGLLLLISLVIASAVYLGCNNGNNILVPGPGTVNKYLSAEVCTTCHSSVGREWENTVHYTALPDLLASGHASDTCIPCHVTGLDDNPANSGYDDPDQLVADRFGGVQCESCHGPGGNHVADFSSMVTNLSGDLCGGCHSGAHHPTYDEWKRSLHAAALDVRDQSSHFSTECLRCHSADYIFADSVPADATPADFKCGITCVVCHDPHVDENHPQLRNNVADLCYQCHNTEDAVPGEGVHHPNGDMFKGQGGYEWPGYTYDNSAHTYLEDGCANCHMWTAPFSATGSGEDAISGHEFKPVIQACQECHADADSFDLFGAQTYIQMLLDTLGAELDAATDADKQTVAYERAKFNYDFVSADGSLGIHNFKYASALLENSITEFEPSK